MFVKEDNIILFNFDNVYLLKKYIYTKNSLKIKEVQNMHS